MNPTIAAVVIIGAIGLFILITAICWSSAEEKTMREMHRRRQADIRKYGLDVADRNSRRKP